MLLSINPMTPECAAALIAWRYPEPYSLYNLVVPESDLSEEIARMCDPANEYFAFQSSEGKCLGFCCCGREARVPGGDYSLEALDVGIGLHPNLIGRHMGTALTAAVLTFLEGIYQPLRFRATVAAFNIRAQRVCEKNGFTRAGSFRRGSDGLEFVVLVKEQEKSL